MYPELLTRHDLNVFLPPISGLTVYIFGDPSFMSRDDKEVTIRPHDECNGSDVFSSDVCTCRPYLAFGIEEAIKGAQKGGSGVIIYFRKEGRALGEVTKYLGEFWGRTYEVKELDREGVKAGSFLDLSTS